MYPLYIITAMIIVGVIATMLFYHSPRWKMTSAVTGEVARTEEREIRDKQGRREETLVVVKYTVRQHDYELNLTFPGRQSSRFTDGRKIPMRYNPADPNMAQLILD